MTHHTTITMVPANILRFVEPPVRPKVKIAGLSLDDDNPFVPLLHTLYPELLDADTSTAKARRALDELPDDAEDWEHALACQTWLTAKASANGMRKAFERVRTAARNADTCR